MQKLLLKKFGTQNLLGSCFYAVLDEPPHKRAPRITGEGKV